MRITIIGTGALACLFASRLHPVTEVVLVGSWPAQMAAIAQNGVQVQEMDGRLTHHALRALPATAAPPADLALVLVKSYQTTAAIERLHACLAPHGRILTLQNGLGNQEQLAAHFGAGRVWAGSTAMGGTLVAPGVVRHAGHGRTHLPTALADVAALFGRAGLETELVDNVESLLWGKLVINAAINPLTALLRQPNGYLARHTMARLMMSAAALETAAVAAALGIPLPYPDPLARVLAVAHSTAANHSSMLQDVLRGSPTEIEAISGQVVKYGRETATPTPVNELLWRLMI